MKNDVSTAPATRRMAPWLPPVAAALGLGLAGPAAAADEAPAPDDWRFEADVYLWGASLGAETIRGDEFDVGFDDIINNLNFAFMGTLGARKDKWSLLTDLIYLNVEGSQRTTANIVDVPVEVSAKLNVQSVISTTAGGYQVFEMAGTGIDLLAGIRYLWLDTDLDFDLGPRQAEASGIGSVIDGIVAVRGRTDITDSWYLTYLADVGTGQSDLTWQALGTINYSFGVVSLAAGYRYLKWNFDDEYPLANLDVQGPLLGLRFDF